MEILSEHGNSVLTEHHLRRPRAPLCAVFVMARPRVICRRHRDESIHCLASARVIDTTARMASAKATSPLSVACAIALLRNCETDRKRQSLGFSPNQINHSGRRSVYTDYLPVRAVDICVPGTPPGGRRATAPNACGGGAPDYAPGYECAVWQTRSAGALAGSVPVACRPPRVPRDAVSPRCRGYFSEAPPEGPNTRPGRRPDDKRRGNGGVLPAYTHRGLSEAVPAALRPPCDP